VIKLRAPRHLLLQPLANIRANVCTTKIVIMPGSHFLPLNLDLLGLDETEERTAEGEKVFIDVIKLKTFK